MAVIENVMDAIKTAIQMEKDGYAFYNRAASQTKSEMGRSLFESLSKDELQHLNVFEKLFQQKVDKVDWDALVNTSKKYVDIPIFPKNLSDDENSNPDINELDALHLAMDSEKEAINYYNKIRESIADKHTQDILTVIIEQEKNHYQLLEEEFNHLSKTGYWYQLDILGG
jgi:rubrerythrin